MFNFCPACGRRGIDFDEKNRFSCAECGFVYYHNTAAAAGLFVKTTKGLLFLERSREPAVGKLDVPGGFIEPGEGLLEGLRRECREELGWDCGEEKLVFLSSFPNIYPYKGLIYNTCDMFFMVEAPALSSEDLRLEKDEIRACKFILPSKIAFEDLAFDSARRALAFMKNYKA